MMEQTNLNIGTIGQKLETARQVKGVSVSEAGRATKILTKFIEAMESDNFGALSAPVYARSFIKMYAKYLGIDPIPLVEEYANQHAPKAKSPLRDEVRKSLAATDQISVELPKSESQGDKSVFSEINQTVSELSSTRFSPKVLAMAGGGFVVLLLLLVGVKQCAGDDQEAPAAAGGTALEGRQLLYDSPPDVYLVKPGVVEVNP